MRTEKDKRGVKSTEKKEFEKMLITTKHFQYVHAQCSINLLCTTIWFANMQFMPVTQREAPRQAPLLLNWGGALRDVTNNSFVSCHAGYFVRDYFDLLYSLWRTMLSFFFFIAQIVRLAEAPSGLGESQEKDMILKQGVNAELLDVPGLPKFDPDGKIVDPLQNPTKQYEINFIGIDGKEVKKPVVIERKIWFDGEVLNKSVVS